MNLRTDELARAARRLDNPTKGAVRGHVSSPHGRQPALPRVPTYDSSGGDRDLGDNESAGPIMRLVLDYQPDNYMALYHAGMAEWTLGDHERARTHLVAFRHLYGANDFFGTSADSALRAMAEELPTEHLAVAVATNTGFPLSDIAREIVAAYVPGFAAQPRADPFALRRWDPLPVRRAHRLARTCPRNGRA